MGKRTTSEDVYHSCSIVMTVWIFMRIAVDGVNAQADISQNRGTHLASASIGDKTTPNGSEVPAEERDLPVVIGTVIRAYVYSSRSCPSMG